MAVTLFLMLLFDRRATRASIRRQCSTDHISSILAIMAARTGAASQSILSAVRKEAEDRGLTPITDSSGKHDNAEAGALT